MLELGSMVKAESKSPSVDRKYSPNTQLGYCWISEAFA